MIYVLTYIPSNLYLIKSIDSLVRYDKDPIKYFILGGFSIGLLLLAFDSVNYELKYLENGFTTINNVGILRIWLYGFSFLQTILWFYYVVKIYQNSPPDLKNSAKFTVFGGIWLSIMPYIIALTEMYRIIPGAIFLSISIGSTILALSFHYNPKLCKLLIQITTDSKVRYFYEVEQKLTELQKQLSEQTIMLIHSQKLESLGKLIGGVTHDVNNVLQIILGLSEEALSEEEMSKTLKTRLEDIRYAALRARSISQQLLTFARKSTPIMKALDIEQELNALVPMIKQAVSKSISFELKIIPPLGMIKGNSTQIHQAILNLAINAGDAMKAHGSLIISARSFTLNQMYSKSVPPKMKPGKYLLISVKDTGSGMEDEVKNHLFEPFFTTKPEGKGTGLGLAVVFGIIKTHDGYIDFTSNLGVGSEFRMYFPLLD